MAFRVAGGLLLALPFLPLDWWFPGTPGATALVGPLEWLNELLIFGASAWLLALVVRSVPRGWSSRLEVMRDPPAWAASTLLLALAALLVIVSWEVFRHRPLLIDSIAQLFHATVPGWATYTSGLLLILFLLSVILAFFLAFVMLASRSNLSFLPVRDYRYFVAEVRERAPA